MRFRLGLVTGLAAGYYLGTRAGRQRYDQINRQLTKLKHSEAFDEAADRARAVVTEGVEKARSLVDRGAENGAGATLNGSSAPAAAGLVVPGATAPDPTAGLIVPGPADLTGLGDVTELTDPAGPGPGPGAGGAGGYSSSR